jgi:hypothetical protein
MALPHPRQNPPAEPVLRDFHNIECRDAVLAYDAGRAWCSTPHGKPVTRWDGRTTKPHPVTGEEVPDETARVQSAVHRQQADARGAGRRLRRGATEATAEVPELGRLTSCTGGTERPDLRGKLLLTQRYIVTPETSKFRVFSFLDAGVLPDNRLTCVTSDDAFVLAVLSSRCHVTWALHAGGTLEDRPIYTKSTCFDPFPFPNPSMKVVERIRDLGEQLDAHRKARQAEHAGLTITGMYNVLEKLRSGAALTAKERVIHEQGLVSVLKQIHDELDAAVFEAYGWPPTLTDEEILERLVALNHERAEEEDRGIVRSLRPEFQNPAGAAAGVQTELPSGVEEGAQVARPAKAEKREWPKELPLQVAALRDLLDVRGTLDVRSAKEGFRGARVEPLTRALDSLAALGIAVAAGEGTGRVWASNRLERKIPGNGQNR